jgi:hypothetical protein
MFVSKNKIIDMHFSILIFLQVLNVKDLSSIDEVVQKVLNLVDWFGYLNNHYNQIMELMYLLIDDKVDNENSY